MLDGEERPWGKYEVLLDAPDCKVKRITVNPDQRLSYQYHHKRTETWVVISGSGLVTLDDVVTPVEAGSIINIGLKQSHRVQSNELDPLVFIEVQQGTYFGEDDIVRLEDDYGREGTNV